MYLLYIGRKSTYINIDLFCSFRIGKLFFQYTHFVKYFNLIESDIIILCYCCLIKYRVWRNDNIAWRHFPELNNGMMVPPPFHLNLLLVAPNNIFCNCYQIWRTGCIFNCRKCYHSITNFC